MKIHELIQKMTKEGLNEQDFRGKEHLFRFCSKCYIDFDNIVKPVLLKCGHVCCPQCTDDSCGQCAQPI